MIADHLIGNRDFWRFFGDRDLIGITIVDDCDLSDFFSKMSLSISITLNNSYGIGTHAMTSQNELNVSHFFFLLLFRPA